MHGSGICGPREILGVEEDVEHDVSPTEERADVDVEGEKIYHLSTFALPILKVAHPARGAANRALRPMTVSVTLREVLVVPVRYAVVGADVDFLDVLLLVLFEHVFHLVERGVLGSSSW